ncbi:glycosyltransferase family 2 protein [Methanosphaerula subterraneus]|uniref:glycosyltransferase family 2 protein n=1 Tax=Methanosphaerula subterraneus TaxID=3350244 RepID=UPI003F833F9F
MNELYNNDSSKPNTPAISVIMPVYNGESFLGESIESILNQTYTDFELILIDDGSRDKSLQIMKNYSDPRIIIIQNEKNIGLVGSLNKGIKDAHGEYIARMDQDDVSHPQRFEKQIEYLERNPDVGLCGTWANITNKEGEIIDFFKPSSTSDLIKWDLHFFCAIAHPSVIVRKSFFERNGQYLNSDIHCEDYALWVRGFNNTKMSNIPLLLINLRKHDLNISKTYSEIQMNHAIKVSQTALSSTLKYEIPLNNVRIIYRQSNIFSTEEYITTTKNLRQLKHSYLENPNLSHEDKKYIKKSMSMILYNIGTLPVRRNPILSLYIIALSFTSEPIFFIKNLGNLVLTRRFLKTG